MVVISDEWSSHIECPLKYNSMGCTDEIDSFTLGQKAKDARRKT